MANVGTAQNSPVLTSEQLAALKKVLADFIVSIDTAIENVNREVNKRCVLDPTCAVSRVFGDSYYQVQNGYTLYTSWRGVAQEIVDKGTVSGKPVTQFQAQNVLRAGSNAASIYSDAMQNWINTLPTSIGGKTALDGAKYIAQRGKELADALDAILRAATKLVKWLPLIVVGALVIPFLFRTGSAYKRGGTAAALDEAAGQIERGRSAAGRGFSWAARKAGSGGIAGMRRRRDRRGRFV
jgi:hypothetical protein